MLGVVIQLVGKIFLYVVHERIEKERFIFAPALRAFQGFGKLVVGVVAVKCKGALFEYDFGIAEDWTK